MEETTLKYSYYPGCTASTTAVEYGLSSEAVCEALGIELIELEDWNCCGATSGHALSHELATALPGRNVAIAQAAGLDMAIPCPACYQRCLLADERFREDAAWRAEMEELLDFEYTGQARPRNLLEIMGRDFDLDDIAARVKKPLAGLKPVSYYGCVLVRPPELTGWDDPEHPVLMDRLLRAMKDSGCVGLILGLESPKRETLREAGKSFVSPATYEWRIRKIQSYGINLWGAFIFGFDHDTWKDCRDACHFAQRMNLSMSCYPILTPYPGTHFFEQFKREGRI